MWVQIDMAPRVIAHRGASGEAPENTMAAFELAHAQGADMIELDVMPAADGTLVVFHDDTTRRWNGRPDLVSSLTWDDLRGLSIRGEPVPAFEEVCRWAVQVRMPLNVELKVSVPGIEARVVELIRRFDLSERVIVSCFSAEPLLAMRALAPELPRGLLMDARPPRAEAPLREAVSTWWLRHVGAQAWHPAAKFPRLGRLVPAVRRHRYQVNVWTVDDPAAMRELIALGVDGIITNYPARLRDILDRGNGT